MFNRPEFFYFWSTHVFLIKRKTVQLTHILRVFPMTAPGPGYLVLFYFCFLSKFVRLLFHHHLLLFLCLHIEHEHNKLYMLCRKTIWSDNSVPGNICRERETNREHGFWKGVEILLVIFYDHKYPDGNIRDTVTSNMGRCVIGFQIDKTKQMALCHTPNVSLYY